VGSIRGLAGRLALMSAIAVTAVAITAGPASAHVEVSADKTQAGATGVTLSFNAESESQSAGIVSLRVVLPAGITSSEVSWASGPSGWSLKPAADGYTVAGPALKAGTDGVYKVKVAKLPANATTLAFKTLQTYSDGRIDRWIEIPEGTDEPEHPAPMLKLAPAAATATTSPSATTTTNAAPAVTSAAPTTTRIDVAAAPDDGGSGPWIWILLAAVVILAALGYAWWTRRRRDPAGGA
jgi:uncharacterized protein YcnI